MWCHGPLDKTIRYKGTSRVQWAGPRHRRNLGLLCKIYNQHHISGRLSFILNAERRHWKGVSEEIRLKDNLEKGEWLQCWGTGFGDANIFKRDHGGWRNTITMCSEKSHILSFCFWRPSQCFTLSISHPGRKVEVLTPLNRKLGLLSSLTPF